MNLPKNFDEAYKAGWVPQTWNNGLSRWAVDKGIEHSIRMENPVNCDQIEFIVPDWVVRLVDSERNKERTEIQKKFRELLGVEK